MDYPNGFNIPTFPAGKTLALSRSFSIWIAIIFFMIVAFCGFIVLGIRFKTNYPFLISVDPITDEWSVVAYPDEFKKPMQQYQIIQEKLVNDFVTDWFTISNNANINESRWSKCSVDECDLPEQYDPTNTECAISCKCSADVFKEFHMVSQQYKEIENTDTWRVLGMQILPITVSENASSWQVYAIIQTSNASMMKRVFNVLVFMDIARNTDGSYPATFGYYVKQFNSYRITQ